MPTYSSAPSLAQTVYTLHPGVVPIAFKPRYTICVPLLGIGREQNDWLDANCAGRFVASIGLKKGGLLVLEAEFEADNDALMFKLAWGAEA